MKFILLIFLAIGPMAWGQNQPFRFAWLTDVHIVRGSESIEDLKKSVRDINAMNDIKFIIFTGDISDFGYKEDMLIAKKILDSLKKPYYIVPGNHDTKWTGSGATAFDEVFGHHNIHFNFGNIEFIGYQTGPIARRGDGYVSPPDLRWIKQQLEDAKKKGRTIIPYTHYPLNKSISNWYVLTRLFKQYDVRVALAGHGHRNQKMNFDGIPAVMARTNTSRNNAPVGYTLVDVKNDSIYFSERNPELNKTAQWHQLPFKKIDYSKDKKIYYEPGYEINKEYNNVKELWKLNLPGGISGAAAYAGNKIIVADREGNVYCLALTDGRKLWQFHAGKGIFSTPAISGNKVVFGSVDHFIYCLDLANGKLAWKFKAGSYVMGSAAIENGKIYIGASDGNFRALDLATGKVLWEYGDVKGWIDTKPVLYQGKVYFGAWDNFFYALDQQTGKLHWKWTRSPKESFPSAFYAPGACWPVAAHGRVFITGPDMILTALNAQTGDSIWRSGIPKLNEAIGVSGDGSKIFVKCTFDSTLLAYSTVADTPEVIWKTPDHYGFDDNQAAIIEKDGTAFFPFRNGWLIAVNSSDGKVLWKHDVGNLMLNPATPISNKKVVITDEDGNVMLLVVD
jgi:outer membrane protein assembly factor BamB/predicted phosphodiesterase